METLLIGVVSLFVSMASAAEPLRIPLHATTVSLDPTGVQDSASLWVSRQINCQLVRMSGREPKLEAAADIQYVSPTRIKFNVKPDVTFHDGKPVLARDVVASLEYLKTSRKVLRNVFEWIQAIRAPSDHVVELDLVRPVPQFLKFLGSPNYTIHPADFVKKAKKNPALWNSPVGCGGYKVSKWDKTQNTLRLEPVRTGRPIEFQFMEGQKFKASSAALFDLIDSAFLQNLPKTPPEFREAGSFDPKQMFFALNTQLPRWKTKEARCEVFSKLEVDPILSAYQGSQQVEAAKSIFPRGVLGYSGDRAAPNPALAATRTSPDKQPFCVAFLGLSVPVELRDPYTKALHGISQSIRVNVIDDPKTFGPTFIQSGCDAIVIGLKSNYLDGYEFLLPLAEPTANFTGFEDPALAASIRATQTLSDSADRARAYQEVEAKIQEQCLIKPLVTIPYRRVLVKNALTAPGIGEVPLNEYYLGAVSGDAK